MGRDWLLAFYDPVSKLLGTERLRSKLLEQAALQPGHRVLDIGCGTGSFGVFIKRLHPQVEVIGLDPDPKALARAARKAAQAGLAIQFTQGFADELPFPDASFDRVFSTLMFHHVPKDAKDKTLREVRRALKPDGTFHLMDVDAARRGRDGLLVRLLHSAHHMPDDAEDRMLSRMSAAGLRNAKRTGEDKLLLWRVAYYRASAPAS
jgi:ubiquinone/menaquinone biosynthesis C-methylase UbiE